MQHIVAAAAPDGVAARASPDVVAICAAPDGVAAAPAAEAVAAGLALDQVAAAPRVDSVPAPRAFRVSLAAVPCSPSPQPVDVAAAVDQGSTDWPPIVIVISMAKEAMVVRIRNLNIGTPHPSLARAAATALWRPAVGSWFLP